jgi:hypothetical protein
MVIGVPVLVENRGAFDCRDRGRNAVDGFRLAAFAEVWYTLNQAIFDF